MKSIVKDEIYKWNCHVRRIIMNVLVLDIGTSSMRGILFKENGKKLFITQKSYKLINKKRWNCRARSFSFKRCTILCSR